MRLSAIRDHVRDNIRRFGLSRALFDVAIRGINRVFFFKTLKAFHVNVPDPAHLQANEAYQCGFLDMDRLMHLSRHREDEMSAHFVQNAVKKGDACFGILNGNILASYGWYSNQPTEISEDLGLYFNSQYMYMYKGFTHPDYRGQRLFGIGMTIALRTYLDRGFTGLVLYVEANNFASLRSVYKIGCRAFGTVYVVKMFGQYLIHCTKGCRDYGFRVEPRIRLLSSSTSRPGR